jgi:CBS domain-containing protein
LILSKLRTVEGLKNEDSGQFINLEELSKIDKEKLKKCSANERIGRIN